MSSTYSDTTLKNLTDNPNYDRLEKDVTAVKPISQL